MTKSIDTSPWQTVYDDLGVAAPEIDDTPLGTHVERNAIEFTHNVALQYFDREITCTELNELANKLANALETRGVGRGDVVGFCMPNIPQYAVGIVAVSKLGCAGSGVSPLLSPSELTYQIEDAGISVLIILDGLLPVLQKSDSLPACLKTSLVAGATDFIAPGEAALPEFDGIRCESYLSATSDASADYAQQPVDWNDTFMIQYTGGTTGKPKGAQLSIRNLMYNIDQTSVYATWDQGGEIVATAFPMFHVAGLAYAIAAMRIAGRMIMVPDPRDLDFFIRQMTRFPPTRMAAVPTLYQMLVAHPDISKVDFSGLKHALTGAAPLTSEDRAHIDEVIGAGKLSDVFGMTETGPVHVCNPPTSGKPASVGIPVPAAETRIVDIETGTEEMPFGEPGEIVTTGPHVMKGYLNLPEESRHAIRQWRGKTWMFTGDVGYMEPDGYIYLCDRAKDMLIVGGFKVFSVEVEDKLKQLDFIAESAVVATPDEKRPGNDVVNLYVQLAPESADMGQSEVEEKIIAFCRENMSAYKVPKVVRLINEIPLTPIGKIDKKVLRDLANS